MISVFASNYKEYLPKHIAAFKDYCNMPSRSKKFKLSVLDSSISNWFRPVIDNFEELLSADPSTLLKLKEHFDGLTTQDQTELKRELNLQGLYDVFVASEKLQLRGGEIYGSKYVSKNLNVKACPYCNENWVYSFKYRSRGKSSLRRTFEWDHIFPQSKYPFLAISFFNLVPSCKLCNHLKNQDIPNLNTHEFFNPDEHYRFNVLPKNLSFLVDPDAISLRLIMDNRKNLYEVLKESMNTVEVLSRYNSQKSLVMEIFNRKVLYQKDYCHYLMRFDLKNPDSQINVESILFGNRTHPSDYFRKPFAKLTEDIFRI